MWQAIALIKYNIWHHSTHAWLLGWSGGSCPPTKEPPCTQWSSCFQEIILASKCFFRLTSFFLFLVFSKKSFLWSRKERLMSTHLNGFQSISRFRKAIYIFGAKFLAKKSIAPTRILYVCTSQTISNLILTKAGPWWWRPKGHRARLLLQCCMFKSLLGLQFFIL